MADFEQVLNKAVAGLAENSAEQRRALYDRARSSLVAQLKALNPPLPQTEIAKQRLALEHAIRRVEGQIALQEIGRRNRPDAAVPVAPLVEPIVPAQMRASEPVTVSEPPAFIPPDDVPKTQAEAPKPQAEAPKPQIKSPRLGGRSAPVVAPVIKAPAPVERLPSDEDMEAVVNSDYAINLAEKQAGQHPIRIINTIEEAPPRSVPDEYSALHQKPSLVARLLHRLNTFKDLLTVPDLPSSPLENAAELEPARRVMKPPRFGRGSLNLAQRRTIMVAMLMLITFIGAGVVLMSSDMIGRVFSSVPRAVIGAVTGDRTPSKSSERLEAETENSTAAKAQVEVDETIPVAQTVILYEENPNVPQQGEAFKGQVLWRIDTETGTDGKPEKLMRGALDIPQRKMKLTLTVRRNLDPSLPASHTVELLFDLPPDFIQKGISSVPGVLMKPAEQARGVPLVGASARITNSYFLIGLSNLPADKERNILMLKERSWIEIPLLYDTRLRAVLVMEKGTSGERMFNQVFASWKQ